MAGHAEQDELPQPSKKNGNGNVLLALANSSSKWVQLGTLALVGLSGLGSFLQTAGLSQQSHNDREQAVREIHTLFTRIDEFENRQKKSLANQEVIIESLDSLKRKTP